MKKSKFTISLLIIALITLIASFVLSSLLCGYLSLVIFALSVVSANGDIANHINSKAHEDKRG